MDRELFDDHMRVYGFYMFICRVWGFGCPPPCYPGVWRAPGGVKHHNVVTEAKSLATLASGDPGPESRVLVREWDPEINITSIIVRVDWIARGGQPCPASSAREI